jgi:hypothetical protein
MQRRRRARLRPGCPWRSASAWARRSDFASVPPRPAVQSSRVCRCAEPGRQDVRAQEQEQERKSPAVRAAPSPLTAKLVLGALECKSGPAPQVCQDAGEHAGELDEEEDGDRHQGRQEGAPAARCAPLFQSIPPFHLIGCSTSARHSRTGLPGLGEPVGLCRAACPALMPHMHAAVLWSMAGARAASSRPATAGSRRRSGW